MKSGQRITGIRTREPRIAFPRARTLYHRLPTYHYSFYTETYFVSVVCPEDKMYKEVSGHLVVNIASFVHSNTLKTFRSELHQRFTINLINNVFPLDVLHNLNFSSIKYVTNNLSELSYFF